MTNQINDFLIKLNNPSYKKLSSFRNFLAGGSTTEPVVKNKPKKGKILSWGEKRRKEMALLSKQGKSNVQIAKKYNLSPDTIKKLLKKAFFEGYDTGKIYGTPLKESKKLVQNELREQREHKAKDLREQREHKAKDMASLTQQGFSIKQIAEKYNISRQRVHQILKLAKTLGCEISLIKPELKTNECVVCQKQFLNIHRPNCKTCSKDCQKQIQRGGEWSQYEFLTLTCDFCSNLFERSRFRHKLNQHTGCKRNFCCVTCSNRHKKISIK